ncbi:uncharacterized protein PAC_17516 [Phialocephala subalpina]|uniref:Mid2 domain-containing protein n=1 Tax=Phialocephala subalpina TaxID=576137 RepID=A0A1L7XRQ8_9HELO|nr:uncharacterized protein PAC_17516 [Phialocephala subalpina]
MRRPILLFAFVTSCESFGFINPSFPNVFVGEPSTVSWGEATALPVSLTLLSNTTSGRWAIAAGIYDTEFVWTPWDTGNLDDGYVMLLVDGNGNSSSSLPFLIQDPSIEIIPLTSNETDTSSINTTSSSDDALVLSPRSAKESSSPDFSLPAAASTFVTVSAPSEMTTLITITASFLEAASTTILASFPAAATTTIPSILPIIFSTETLSAPTAESTDSAFSGDFATRDDTEFEVASKQVIRLTDGPQNLTSTSNSTISEAPTTSRTKQVRLAVSITIVVLLVFVFSILIAFEYGKRVTLRILSSSSGCGQSFRGEAELHGMNSSKGLRLLSLLRMNSDKVWEANEMRREGIEPVSSAEGVGGLKGKAGFRRGREVKSIYEMA